jgi:hypothetical protein
MAQSVPSGSDTNPVTIGHPDHGSAYACAVTNKDNVDDALAAAVTNAALEGIHVTEDEQDLIRLHQSGAIDKDEFLRRATALAEQQATRPRP